MLELHGDISARGRGGTPGAPTRRWRDRAARSLLDFTDVDYINSTGIALIVGILAEARKQRPADAGRAGSPTTTGRSSASRGSRTS